MPDRGVELLAPGRGSVDAEALVAELAAAPAIEPFANDAVACCGALSRALFELAGSGGHRELMALAHWLRPVSVLSMRHQFGRASDGGGARAPRGVAFHVAPANADALAGYSLALSLLVGNRNVVRISPRAGEHAELLCRALDGVLAAERFAGIRAGTAIVRYGPEAELDEAFSRACDVRIVWGDEETVAALRQVPLAPAAKELAFPDRFSFALASAAAYLDAGEHRRELLADQLYRDARPLEERARLLVWVGSPEDAAAAGADLFGRLEGRAREIEVVAVPDLDRFDRGGHSAGRLFEARVPELSCLTDFVTSRDQAVTAFGLPADEVGRLALAGVDRHWDDFDLLSELTRPLPVRAAA